MRKIISLLLILSMTAVLAAGCSSEGNAESVHEDPQGKADQTVSTPSGNTAVDLNKANQQFAFDIFRQINKEDKDANIFISPLSISTALSMAYQGAGGTTKDAMAKALGYSGISTEELNKSYRKLLNELKKADKKIDLNISNSIWIRDDVPVNDTFLKTNKKIFDAKAAAMDFSKDSTADTINKWISESTKGKIQKMIEPPIDSYVMMYLINAIYFKGQWQDKFDKDRTFSSVFNSGNGKKADIMMMSRTDCVEYASGGSYRAVRLPYGSGRTAMYVILPDENVPMDEFIEALEPDFWDELNSSLRKTDDVILQIPRFKLEYGIKELKDSLSALGMGKAFSDDADFTGIRENVYISSVMHKAVIEVNEEGSEAAGVTSVEFQLTSALSEQIKFIADRPFIFAIADHDTGTILFLGKLTSM
jgi:serine protease inhibitor